MITFYNFRFEPVKALTLTSLTLIIIQHLTLITTPFTLFCITLTPSQNQIKSDSPLWSCLESHNERFMVRKSSLSVLTTNSVIRSELIASKDEVVPSLTHFPSLTSFSNGCQTRKVCQTRKYVRLGKVCQTRKMVCQTPKSVSDSEK